MQFVLTENLKIGMRLAKPIYNKNGVLLYDRDSKLTIPAINSIHNFGLIGIYILEPAEPLPPLSREDIEFEQLQTVYMFRLREIMDNISKRKKIETLPAFIDDILKHFGSLDHRVNFNQNLRSSEDFLYKHAISTAILVAMLTSKMNYTYPKKKAMITAALLSGIGYQYVPKVILEKTGELNAADAEMVQRSLTRGLDFLSNYRGDFDFFPRAIAVSQLFIYQGTTAMAELKPDEELQNMLNLFKTADCFDNMTAMRSNHNPKSEIRAMQFMQKNPEEYWPEHVKCLADCIHICPVAASVDFTNGEKGIVLVENPEDFMHPVVLCLSNNHIYNLADPNVSSGFSILDIMKTMDNRIQMDEETLKLFVPDERLREITRRVKAGFSGEL